MTLRSLPAPVKMCGELIYAAKISQLWIEAVLYGIYLNLFAGCIYIYTKRRSNKYALAMCIAMFVTATGEILIDLVNDLLVPRLVSDSYSVSGTLFACEGTADAERTRQSNIYQRVDNVSFIFFITKLWLGDSILVYRCYMIWAKQRWVAMVPAFLLFVTIVFGYAQVGMSYQYYYAQLRSQATPSPASTADVISLGLWLYRLNTVSTATSVALNIIVTCLIVYRIWRDTFKFANSFGLRTSKKYSTVISMVVESGAIYTAALLAELISNNFKGDPAYVANDISDAFTAMLVVIAPSLIIIRVGLNQGYVESSGHSTTLATDPSGGSRPAHSLVFAPRNLGKSTGNETSLSATDSLAMLDFNVQASPAMEERS